MIEKQVSQDSPEGIAQPVEVSFGKVVRFIEDDGTSDFRYVIIDPTASEHVSAAKILNETEGEEEISVEGTKSSPLEIEGSWSLDKIVAARVRNATRDFPDDAAYSGRWLAVVKQHYELSSQKDSVIYTGQSSDTYRLP